MDKAEIEVVRRSFSEEARRSFVEDPNRSFADDPKKSFADSVYSSDLEILSFDEFLLQDRLHDLEAVETVMHDVHNMMKDCALMVNDQGDMIDRIEVDVEDAWVHTEKGNKELVEADEYQRST